MIARVLVAVDSPDDLALVDRACALAAEHRARVELVGGIAKAAFTVALVACPKTLNAELEAYSRALLADAVARVPPDTPDVWRHVRGCARRRLLHAAGDCGEDCVVLVGRLPWWARGALRRRLSRLVLLPDGPAPGAERALPLRDGAGTLA